MQRTRFVAAAAMITTGIVVTGCGLQSSDDGGGGGSEGAAEETSTLVIYSPRPAAITDEIIPMFEEAHPEYDVELLTLGAAEVADRVRAEGGNPQADVWWGGTPPLFEAATEEGLIEPFSEDVLTRIPEEYHGTDSAWFAEQRQLQLIAYNHDMLTEDQAPQDWSDLVDPRFEGQILIRDVAPSGTMRGIYASLIYQDFATSGSPEAGYQFLLELDRNTIDYAANPEDLYLRLQRQEAAITLWNHQDMLTQAADGAPFSIIVPESGAAVNLDGIARVAGGANPEGADAFADFLVSDDTQAWLAENAFQIPTIEITSEPEWLAEIEIRELEVERAVIAEHEAEWIDYWLEHIKNQG